LALFGRLIWTLWPVDFTYGVSTSPASAVVYIRAKQPPPVSSARCCPLSLSNQRGLITQLYLSSKSRFCGAGRVVWFHGCRMSMALPSGSVVTKGSSPTQSW